MTADLTPREALDAYMVHESDEDAAEFGRRVDAVETAAGAAALEAAARWMDRYDTDCVRELRRLAGNVAAAGQAPAPQPCGCPDREPCPDGCPHWGAAHPDTVLRDQIRAAVHRSGQTQVQIAGALGVSQKHLSQMLTGRAVLTLEWAERIAGLCGHRVTVAVTAPAPQPEPAPERDDTANARRAVAQLIRPGTGIAYNPAPAPQAKTAPDADPHWRMDGGLPKRTFAGLLAAQGNVQPETAPDAEPGTPDLRQAIIDAIRPTMLVGLQDAELDGPGGAERIREWAAWIADAVLAVRDDALTTTRRERDSLGHEANRLRRDYVTERKRAESAEQRLTAVLAECDAIDRDRARLDADDEHFGDGYADAAARIRIALGTAPVQDGGAR